MDLCLFAGEIQVFSGRGLRTDFEGSRWMPLLRPTELERAGIAFGEVGFSPTIGEVWRRLGDAEEDDESK